jgi:hypothetical protein
MEYKKIQTENLDRRKYKKRNRKLDTGLPGCACRGSHGHNEVLGSGLMVLACNIIVFSYLA